MTEVEVKLGLPSETEYEQTMTELKDHGEFKRQVQQTNYFFDGLNGEL